MNYVMLEGRLGNDPEAKPVGDNQVVSARVAVRRYDPKADGKFATDWYSLNAWGEKGAAAVLVKMSKGESLVVFGRLEMKEYTDREGNPKLDPSVYVMNVVPKRWIGDDDVAPPKRGGSKPSKKEDDLPF